MHSGLTNEVDSGARASAFQVRDMTVGYYCNLRELTANFTWHGVKDDAPDRLWLEISLFKDLWDPHSEFVQQISLDPGNTSASLPVETDSVYYWRLVSERNRQISETEIKQIHTPNCVADFVDER